MNVKAGDDALVIESVDGACVGLKVKVVSMQGVHSQLGPIWRCTSSTPIVTEYGGVGNEADFADSWLMRIEPDAPVEEKQLELVVTD